MFLDLLHCGLLSRTFIAEQEDPTCCLRLEFALVSSATDFCSRSISAFAFFNAPAFSSFFVEVVADILDMYGSQLVHPRALP
jgi:hypothetical protein